MRRKLTALLLCLCLIFSTYALSSCAIFAPSMTNPDDPDDPKDPLNPPEDPEAPEEEPYDPPASDYNPGDWFNGSTTPSVKPDTDTPAVDPDDEYDQLTFDAKIAEALKAALAKIDYCIESYDGKFPNAYSTNNVYKPGQNKAGWVQGFWTGVLWQAYEFSGDEKYKTLASSQVDSFYTRIDEKLGTDNHDMGFLYTPSCVAAYKLTGDETAKEAALMAADNLLTRYHADAGFIQAWGTVGDEAEYRLIVDCLMNMPILYWASEVSGDSKYADVATRHIASTFETIYRENGSTYHTYYYDPDTKEPSHGATKQGYSDESTWSRGQAWAMYGPVLAYTYTEDPACLKYFKAAADCFISNLPDDYVPYWDFDRSEVDGEPRDTSAAAIAICAILEACNYLGDNDPDKARYMTAARNMMEALIDNYFAASIPTANGLLLGVTQSRKSNAGVNEMTPYGDYFFLEAMFRFNNSEWHAYW